MLAILLSGVSRRKCASLESITLSTPIGKMMHFPNDFPTPKLSFISFRSSLCPITPVPDDNSIRLRCYAFVAASGRPPGVQRKTHCASLICVMVSSKQRGTKPTRKLNIRGSSIVFLFVCVVWEAEGFSLASARKGDNTHINRRWGETGRQQRTSHIIAVKVRIYV